MPATTTTIRPLYDFLSENTTPGLDLEERARIKKFQDLSRSRHERMKTNPPRRGDLGGGQQYKDEAELRGRWSLVVGLTSVAVPVRRGALAMSDESRFRDDCEAADAIVAASRSGSGDAHAPAMGGAPWDLPSSNYSQIRRQIRAQYRSDLGDRRIKTSLDTVAENFVRDHPGVTKAEASRILASVMDRSPSSVLQDLKKRRGIGRRLEWVEKRSVVHRRVEQGP